MARTDLKVPYNEKDEAKALGARWDAKGKTWFVPDGADPSPFKRWLPSSHSLPIQAAHFELARTDTDCWKCNERTTVYCVVIPAGSKILEPGDDEFEDEWRILDESVVLSHIHEITPEAASMIQARAPGFRPGFSKTTNSIYWVNHCKNCSFLIGDFYMHQEPGGEFFPLDQQDADRILRENFEVPIGVDGNYGNSSFFP